MRYLRGNRMILAAAAVAAVAIGPTAGATHGPPHNGCSDQVADVSIGIDAAPPGPYTPGDVVTLTVTAENQGPCPAPQVEIQLTTTGSLTLGPGAPSDGAYDQLERTWVVNLGQPSDEKSSESLEVSATINSVGSHSVTATRTSGHFTDLGPGNDSDTAELDASAATTTTTSTSSTSTSSTTGSTGTTTTSTGTTTTSTSTTTTTTATDQGPVEGHKINAEETTGEVIVQLPGQDPRPIDPNGELLPPGTKIDATNGTVAITSDYNGELEKMVFWAGAFQLGQTESQNPVTIVRLIGGLDPGPQASAAGRAQTARKKGGKARRLWGKGNRGHYETRGRSGSATVRGTRWLTVDRRNGSTLFRLRRGKLAINDFAKRGKVDKILKGRGAYIAKPAKPRR